MALFDHHWVGKVCVGMRQRMSRWVGYMGGFSPSESRERNTSVIVVVSGDRSTTRGDLGLESA